ncbi:MAG: hypothetical protein E6Q88_01805 [Lysobacteraceae bacterium]|nr:MAG: hypothetical protein E6Q88_01805 [Xanthomonadaceae bacterium]
MNTFLTLALIASLFATLPAQAQHSMHAASSAQPAASVSAAPQLQATLRGLWRGHVAQTRAYALAVHAGKLRAAQKAEADVIANAKQIADAVGGFYGDAAGERMLSLLAGHWGAVKEMTQATKRKDSVGNAKALETLTANAREIAKFLSGANPYLPDDAVFGLLAAHGAHHATQITQIMRREMKAEASTRAAMEKHMDTIADALAQALARQFPTKAH